jgi:hypothetical protein
LQANGSRVRAPDDRLREAIQLPPFPFVERKLDCFVASLLAMTCSAKIAHCSRFNTLPPGPITGILPASPEKHIPAHEKNRAGNSS